ncbi:cupin domain-containing protein [Halomonas marinisediminis]|uniref:Cupin domain-containing protein n=1 Tax=Halomonas marinisediminis TaxID=2546095 RepID=A0ABY2D8S5_9GAMM|nr:cupin domain-containing protein [Halomonas marinisediminis]TDB03308.1 cupin domain-containing protein [Halomonas marinisediminis]
MFTKQINELGVIVTRWDFPPGGETGWHLHAHDYVVVPLSKGTLALEANDTKSYAALLPGESYVREAGVEHNVINDNDFPFSFVEIEVTSN